MFVNVLPALLSSSFRVTSPVQVFNMSCLRQPAAPPECHLAVYDLVHYNPTTGAFCTTPSCGTPQTSAPTPLPISWRADYDLGSCIANADSTKDKMGTRHPAMTVLLFFHGGPQCNIVLQNPVLRNVTLPVGNQGAADVDTVSTQVTSQVRCVPAAYSTSA
jgi:hypothetical protein